VAKALLVKKAEEEQKVAPRAQVFVKKVENFDWFGATVSTCMHCGKAGHKGLECPDYKPKETRACFKCGVVGHIARDCKVAKKSEKAKAVKSEKAVSDNVSESTVDQSEAERVYAFGHLAPKAASGRKEKNGKVGRPDRLHHSFGAGDLYVGDADCQQKTLEKLGITAVVSAQPAGAQRPKYTGMEHFRFPISDLLKLTGDFNVTTLEGVRRALNPLLEFIESRTQNGQNVLIQCAGGAQHAGACAIAWYMYEEALSLEDALAEAQNLRRRIYLNKGLTSLLEVFEQALEKDTELSFRKEYDAKADHKAMLATLLN